MLRTLVLVLFTLISGTPTSAPAQSLWKGLEAGRHRVGYRSIFQRDLSRSAFTAAPSAGRPMRIGVWYPARPSSRPPMTFERYLADLGRRAGEAQEGAALAAGSAFFIAQAAGLGGNGDSIRARLPSLRATATSVTLDAPVAAGRFPLVIFPEFLSPAGASVLAELLASHGFVVAAVDMKGTFDADYDLGLTGMETQVQDLRFVLGTLRKETWVDPDRVAVLGVGIAANAGLALQMRDPTVRAVVSLDGGLLSPFEDGVTRRTPYFDVAAMTVPILAIWSPHPSLDPALLDAYRYSERLVVHYPGMREFHYLAFGAIERVIPNVLGPAPRDLVAGLPSAYGLVVDFLAHHLAASGRALPADGVAPDSLRLVSRRAALPAPPSLRDIKAVIVAGGADSLVRLWRELRRLDSEPISLARFAQTLNWLRDVFTADPDGRMRRAVMELRLEAHPGSWRAHAGLAQLASATGETALARERARDALRLFDDRDPDLTAAQRTAVRAQLERIAGAQEARP